MAEQPRSARIREINPDDLDFSAEEFGASFDFDAQDRRRFQRALLDVPIAIRLLGKDNQYLCKGTAVLRDLSLDGAFLTAIEISETAQGVDPKTLGEFRRIEFTILDGPFKGVEAAAKPVRVGHHAGGVGVKLEQGFNFAL
ncbi:MAG: PilZ domain-containing protein [Planctomycetes bacterium]|nr:PilZ domain-containing protein [Planctomycetota bacterium]